MNVMALFMLTGSVAAVTNNNATCLYVHVHVAKNGGRTVYYHLADLVSSNRVRGPTCFFGLLQPVCCGSGTEPQKKFAKQYVCGQCRFASAEWRFADVASMGLAGPKSRLLTLVRSPVGRTVSGVQQALHSGENFSFKTMKEWAANVGKEKTSWQDVGYGYGDQQTSWLLGSKVNFTNIVPKFDANYWFVGVVERMWHSLCALDYMLGAFERAKCHCGAPGAPATSASKSGRRSLAYAHGVQTVNDVFDTETLKVIQSSIHLDEILFAHAVTRLSQLLLQIEAHNPGLQLVKCY
uniref:Sulfotransferase n=1 Tax=Calcidiscus leptoporus TaxID=127549 RepID=A0A7S0J1P7_9EUKA